VNRSKEVNQMVADLKVCLDSWPGEMTEIFRT
jgi:hypothetical protein